MTASAFKRSRKSIGTALWKVLSDEDLQAKEKCHQDPDYGWDD